MTASCVALGLVLALAHGPLITAAEASLRRQPHKTTGGHSIERDNQEEHGVLLQEAAAAPVGWGNEAQYATSTPAPSDHVRHQKEPGGGYLPGSPLYAKQQAYSSWWPSAWYYWMKFHWRRTMKVGLATVLFDCLIILIFAFFWRKHKLSHPTTIIEEEGKGDWNFGLFGCLGNFGKEWPICVMACCCPYVRWADTVSDNKLTLGGPALEFWHALGAILVLGPILFVLTGGIATLVLLVLLTYYRQKLRQIYGMQHGGATLCTDCCTWWCCSFCALIQEAKQVERVRIDRRPSFK